MSAIGEGQTHASRELGTGMYLKTGDPGMGGGGTYTGTGNDTTLQQYENIFGPAGRDIKLDQQRHKRHQRWHLPDALKGHNQYLTDRVDGLITDATNSPFTKNILPYVYLENPDQKLKWNVYSFDEGIASRVPYEAAARVLPQSKRSFAGYTVRQGLAIAMEHNFMASDAGRENFKNQLTQLVGSIQLTNDLDVHVALLQAPSYQKHMNEKYYDNSKTTSQICRQYVDLFGIMQKIPNALDILIEDAKTNLQTWGSQPPTFALCNTALTTQLTMLPEKTNFMTNGPDGLKRLAQGPDLASYRGLSIIPTRKFSMDAGTAPRDLLRRRVRVAEYYRIPWAPANTKRSYEFYDQSRDSMFTLSFQQLADMAKLQGGDPTDMQVDMGNNDWYIDNSYDKVALKQSTSAYDKSRALVNLGVGHPPRDLLDTTHASWDPSVVPYPNGVVLQGRTSGNANEVAARETRLTGVARRVGSADNERLAQCMTEAEILALCPNTDYSECLNLGKVCVDETMYSDNEILHLSEQAETFGRGVFNDPIITTNDSTRMLHNFECLKQKGASSDFKKTYLLGLFFDDLNTRLNTVGSKYSDVTLVDSIKKNGSLLADTRSGQMQMMKDAGFTDTVKRGLQPKYASYLFSRMLTLEHFDAGVFAGGPLFVQPFFQTHDGAAADDRVTVDIANEYVTHHDNALMERVCNFLCNEPPSLAQPGATHLMDIMQNAYTEAQNRGVVFPLPFHEIVPWCDPATPEYSKFHDSRGEVLFSRMSSSDMCSWVSLLMRLGRSAVGTDRRIWSIFRDSYNVLATRGSGLNSMSDAEWALLLAQFNVTDFHATDEAFLEQRAPERFMYDVCALTRYLMMSYGVKDDCTYADQVDYTVTCIMASAAASFLEYRRKLCQWSSFAYKSPQATMPAEEIDKMVTILKTKSMVDVSLTDTWRKMTLQNGSYLNTRIPWDGLLFENYNIAQAYGTRLETLGGRRVGFTHTGNNAGGFGAEVLNELKDFYTTFNDSFKAAMLAGNDVVRTAHNVIMIASGSSGGNVTHFPNYHLSRCDALKSSDAARSASSLNRATWMVQHLAAMMPLTDAACQKMMAIHTDVEVSAFNVTTAAEVLTGEVPVGPTAVLKDAHIQGILGAQDAPGGPTQGGYAQRASTVRQPTPQSDEYRSTLMRLLMGVIGVDASADVDDGKVTYVPEFARKTLMLEFANAIRANRTHTDALGKALFQAIPKSSQADSVHVPFCGATACPRLVSTRSAFAAATHEKDSKVCLEKQVDWRNVSIAQQIKISPTPADKTLYNGKYYWVPEANSLGQHLVPSRASDKYLSDVYPWLSDDYSQLSLRPRTAPGVLHSLLSFDPACATQAPAMNARGEQIMQNRRLHDEDVLDAAEQAAAWCSDIANWEEFWAHLVLVFAARFYKASARFVDNGRGLPAWKAASQQYMPTGHAIMHGCLLPEKAEIESTSSTTPQDIVVLRPNIEHEMLGLIMGRGGTQELGATFWGQTELSCYDDAQHGIWGMSYKYHERAMVTNERNLIRTYDVAFDGYNGGMDQSHVVWNDADSRNKFRDAIYDRNQPYHGPSMMVMSFPPTPPQSRQAWPNPIVFHNSAPVGASIDPEQSHGALPNLHEHMVFSNDHNNKNVSLATQLKFERYMGILEMTQWASSDQSTRPAGEACISNETSSSSLAFQGSMRVYGEHGSCVEDIKGSGHLGHSYVGIASVREGRGVLNSAQAPAMSRMI